MLYTIPDNYNEFHCIAEKCEDTCCAGWQIMIDEPALEKYKRVKGDYRKQLWRSIDWRQKSFRQKENRRCAFLKEDNLCEMYQQMGEKSLCKTCRMYPRHVEEFEGVREISLSLSCPEAARMLLSRKEPMKFLSYEKEGEEEFEEFDPFLYSALTEARKIMIDTMQNRKLPIVNRMVLCLGLAWDMEQRVNRGNVFACEEVFEKYRKQQYFSAAGRRAERMTENWRERFLFGRKLFLKMYRMELLNKDWDACMQEAEVRLFSKGKQHYQKVQEAFGEWMGTDWDVVCEHLMVYFIYTYFCGAVYDERIYVNVEMAAECVAFIWDMLAARWLKNGRILNLEDIVEVVYRFSRELEHSDENLKKFWKILEKEERQEAKSRKYNI